MQKYTSTELLPAAGFGSNTKVFQIHFKLYYFSSGYYKFEKKY